MSAAVVTDDQYRPLRNEFRVGAWIVAGLVFMLFGVGPNTALSLLAGVLLVVGVTRLWRPGEPPILLLSS